MAHGGNTASRPVTIRDVAKVAGVSHQTVSRALNGSPHITPETRRKVEDAMQRLGYAPSPTARALAANRSRTIGVLCTDSGSYGPPKVLRAIEWAVHAAGYFVSIVNISDVDEDTLREAFDLLRAQRIEGFILIAPQLSMLTAFRMLSPDVPTVTLQVTGHTDDRYVAIDHREGAKRAVRHLVDLGHREIIHVAGPDDWLDARLRVEGWRQVLADSRLPYRDPIVGTWSPDFGHRTALELAQNLDFTGIFAANDAMALGLMHGFRQAGIRIPEDVSIVGFDAIPESAYFWPPLTTLRPDYSQLGELCVTLLIGTDEGPAESTLLVPDLVVRESTAAPAEDA